MCLINATVTLRLYSVRSLVTTWKIDWERLIFYSTIQSKNEQNHLIFYCIMPPPSLHPSQKWRPGSGLTNQPCKFSGQYQQFRTCGQLEIPKDFFPVSAGLSIECLCTSFFAEAYPYNTVQRHKWKQGRKSASHSTPFVASGLTRLTHHGYNRVRFLFTVLEPDLPLSI